MERQRRAPDGGGLRRQGRRPGHRAQGLHHAPAWARPAAGAARRRQHLGEDEGNGRSRAGARGDRGQRLGRRHGRHRAVGPADGEARTAQTAARARGAVRRGDGQRAAAEPARFHRAQPLGRDAAACLPAAQIRRPHPCRLRAVAGRPARRRGLGARDLQRAHGDRALHRAGLRPRQGGRGGVRAKPASRRLDPAQARHLHVRRGCARGL